ncbi:chemotaxis protein CheW [Deferrisoma camini]|uniref:chemotaxis protein CheW n=1 Tax=Deferrisoma camini TaxID=1035120 RepID=UPI00046CC396|nr:chemotaxis protein CheW [Deferrisoma camini]
MSEGRLEFLCFDVGRRRFAVDIRVVREILRPRPLTRVPGAPPTLRGVFNLRGELIPVADVHRILGEVPPPRAGEEAKLLVVHPGGRPFGIEVDRLAEVESVPLDALAPVPGSEEPGASLVVAMFRRTDAAEDVVLVLRAGALLPEPVVKEVTHEGV